MDTNVYPCIIYQRLRPSCPEASEYARRNVWPLADELVAYEGYTLCARYGDSEFAPPFCGGSEIRPGFEQALEHARRIAAKLGRCALLIGDAGPIGDGDPFLPAFDPAYHETGVDVRVVNFHLRSHARSTSLRSAWRYWERYRQTETRSAMPTIPFELPCSTSDIEVLVRRDPERLLAHLYVANPAPTPIALRWAQHFRIDDPHVQKLLEADWHEITVPGCLAAHVETILQGELPWARQLRFRCERGGRRAVGSAHLGPSDLSRNRVLLILEDRCEC